MRRLDVEVFCESLFADGIAERQGAVSRATALCVRARKDGLSGAEIAAATRRAAVAVRQVLDGEPDPPVKTVTADGLTEVLVDMAGEGLVEDYRAGNWYPEEPPVEPRPPTSADSALVVLLRTLVSEVNRLDADLTDLRLETASLREERGIRFRDKWTAGETYERGDTVLWSGSLWICREATSEKPADGGGAWALAAKKGRDGRDRAPSRESNH